LSAPFLGGLEWDLVDYTAADGDAPEMYSGDACAALAADCQNGWRSVGLEDLGFEGTHFSFFTAENELGQHYFRWLNPEKYGPFDHVMNLTDDKEQADMLSLDEEGNVEDLCTDIGGDCGHTHYLFKAVDENGRTIASQRVETGGDFKYMSDEFKGDYYQVVYSSESGDVTLSVALGRMIGGKFKAMSDTASVMFEAPDDLQALDQTFDEYQKMIYDIVGDYDENDDAVRWLGEDNTGDDRSIWNKNSESSFADAFYGADEEVGGVYDLGDDDAVGGTGADADVDNSDKNQGIVVAHLNNQLK